MEIVIGAIVWTVDLEADLEGMVKEEDQTEDEETDEMIVIISFKGPWDKFLQWVVLISWVENRTNKNMEFFIKTFPFERLTATYFKSNWVLPWSNLFYHLYYQFILSFAESVK